MKKKGFSLSETIIVSIVLGIIATITIPNIVSRHKTSINRTKVKKAMAKYDHIINNMIIENRFTSKQEFSNWADGTGLCNGSKTGTSHHI